MSLGASGVVPIRPALALLPENPPAEPFDAIRQRLGLARIVCLGLNEGQFGPFPAALEALERLVPSTNRYPTRGSTELTRALAERLGVEPAEIVVTAGADAAIGYVCQATIDPGDEIVTPWPSFPSFVRDAQKCGGVAVRVPLVEGRVDVEALLGAVTGRTRLVFVATPNNPTSTTIDRHQLDALLDGLPPHVLAVIDEAYLDFLDPESRLDAVDHALRRGRSVLALRTFSKLFGLAGLRVGYAVGPAPVVAAMRKVQRGYDVGSPAQVAALASLDDARETERRRNATRIARAELASVLTAHGLTPLGGAAGNFLFVDVGTGAEDLAAALLTQGVIVQRGEPFGAPEGIRVTAGTMDEIAFLGECLDRVETTRT